MEFQILRCTLCPMMGFSTTNELATHRLDAHERPVPTARPGLEAEAGVIGRTPLAERTPHAPQ